MTVLSMKTNRVAPTASKRLIGRRNAQKVTSTSWPAHTNGGARVIVNPWTGPWGSGGELLNSITIVGASGRTRLANTKAM